jgi:hypothetical protein
MSWPATADAKGNVACEAPGKIDSSPDPAYGALGRGVQILVDPR